MGTSPRSKAFVRQARSAAGQHLRRLHEKDTQAVEAACGQLFDAAAEELFFRRAEALAHDALHVPEALCRQLGAEGGGVFAAAGEEEGGSALHTLGHRVTSAAMGRTQGSTLPRTAQRRRQ